MMMMMMARIPRHLLLLPLPRDPRDSEAGCLEDEEEGGVQGAEVAYQREGEGEEGAKSMG